jgi:hypothetical protein
VSEIFDEVYEAVRHGAEDVLARRALGSRADRNGGAFERVFVPNWFTGGANEGPGSRKAIWAINNGGLSSSGPDSALGVETTGGYSLTLDPEWTTPGTVLGVHFGDRRTIFMRPGDTLDVPNGFRRFYVYNPMRNVIASLDTVDFAHFPYGQAAFLVGRALGVRPRFQNDVGPRAAIGLLQAGVMTTAIPATQYLSNGGAPFFVTSGLRKGVRYTISCMDSNGDWMVAPSNLSAEVRPWVMVPMDDLTAGNSILTKRHTPFLDQYPRNSTGANGGGWIPNAEGSFTATEFERCFEREVMAGAAACYLQLVSLAGTNVSSIWFTVEGW